VELLRRPRLEPGGLAARTPEAAVARPAPETVREVVADDGSGRRREADGHDAESPLPRQHAGQDHRRLAGQYREDDVERGEPEDQEVGQQAQVRQGVEVDHRR
jgi:hypothetical protein